MKSVILEYKSTVIISTIALLLLVFFVPAQKLYYLDEDIEQVRTTYVFYILLALTLIAGLVAFIVRLKISKSLKESWPAFFFGILTIGLICFWSTSICLGALLFLNRTRTQNHLSIKYVVRSVPGDITSRNNPIIYSIPGDRITIDKKINNEIDKSVLSGKDTVTINFAVGLLGIQFHQTPFKKD